MNWEMRLAQLEKLRFLVGGWRGANLVTFHRSGGGLPESRKWDFRYGQIDDPSTTYAEHIELAEELEFTASPGDVFLSYRYSARTCGWNTVWHGWGLKEYNGESLWSDAGYITACPERSDRFLLYNFSSYGTIRQGTGFSTDDPAATLFQGTTLGEHERWRTGVTRVSERRIKITHFKEVDDEFRSFLVCFYEKEV